MNKDAKFKELLSKATDILIIQADNPDGDSVASSLALEQILHNLGKNPIMYCAIDIPTYLQHLKGWDRIINEIPHKFDLSIIVDCSSRSLLETADKRGQLAWVLAKPTIIIDHHDTTPTIDATLNYTDTKAVSTGEVIYNIASINKWGLDLSSNEMIAVSILSDSLGLMTESTSADSIRIIANLVDKGVNLAKLDEARRASMRKSIELTKYKGQLLQRIEYFLDSSLATITIPMSEIEKYSNIYNPSVLVLDEMRMTTNTKIAIAFKEYSDGKITGKIRANFGFPIAAKLAEHFGGGGHPYASGFKIYKKSLDQLKHEVIEITNTLLIENENSK